MPDRAALTSRRGPASRLIGTFAALCQFSNEWSDIIPRMALFQRKSPLNSGESVSHSSYLRLRPCG